MQGELGVWEPASLTSNDHFYDINSPTPNICKCSENDHMAAASSSLLHRIDAPPHGPRSLQGMYGTARRRYGAVTCTHGGHRVRKTRHFTQNRQKCDSAVATASPPSLAAARHAVYALSGGHRERPDASAAHPCTHMERTGW